MAVHSQIAGREEAGHLDHDRVSSVLTREAAPRRRKERPTEWLCTTHQEGQSVRCSLITGIEIRIGGNLALGLSFLAPAESADDSLATVPDGPYGPSGLDPLSHGSILTALQERDHMQRLDPACGHTITERVCRKPYSSSDNRGHFSPQRADNAPVYASSLNLVSNRIGNGNNA